MESRYGSLDNTGRIKGRQEMEDSSSNMLLKVWTEGSPRIIMGKQKK